MTESTGGAHIIVASKTSQSVPLLVGSTLQFALRASKTKLSPTTSPLQDFVTENNYQKHVFFYN